MVHAFEPVWRCRICCSSGLLSESHTHCANCGHKRDYEAVEFPDWDDLVTAEDHRFTGQEPGCCGRSWSDLARFCGQCGSTLSQANEGEASPSIECLPDCDSERSVAGSTLRLIPRPPQAHTEDTLVDVADWADEVRKGRRSWHV